MTSSIQLPVTFQSRSGARSATISVQNAVIAGWTGRDVQAMEKHIRELEEIGVPRPKTTPIYYRVAAARVTTADEIQAAGGDSSGEVEFVLIQSGGELWVTVGSDHTDRKVETYGITVSKQMCDKPIASVLWPFAEVADHWDSLLLRSYAHIGGKRELYQEGRAVAMRPARELIEKYTGGGPLPDGTVMYGGTFAVKGGIRPADRFEIEMVDETLNRKISHAYAIAQLPIMG
ncbi:MAG: DUF2848 domain-containing protein [Alphaproteobacteria bacterium]|nr:DUF2848 domain-containing protein [Alphaproteobacteria bacterium]